MPMAVRVRESAAREVPQLRLEVVRGAGGVPLPVMLLLSPPLGEREGVPLPLGVGQALEVVLPLPLPLPLPVMLPLSLPVLLLLPLPLPVMVA